jgi:hypothetical protein
LAEAKPLDAGPVGQHKAVKRSRAELLEKSGGEAPAAAAAAPWVSSKKAVKAALAQQTSDEQKKAKAATAAEKKTAAAAKKAATELGKKANKKKEMPKASTASDTKAAEATEEAADVTTDAAQQELVSDLLPMDTWPGAEAVVQPEASDEEQGLDSDDEEKTKRKRGGNKKGRLERQAREGHGYTKFNSLVEHVLKMYQPCQTLHTHTVPHCIYTHIKTS